MVRRSGYHGTAERNGLTEVLVARFETGKSERSTHAAGASLCPERPCGVINHRNEPVRLRNVFAAGRFVLHPGAMPFTLEPAVFSSQPTAPIRP